MAFAYTTDPDLNNDIFENELLPDEEDETEGLGENDHLSLQHSDRTVLTLPLISSIYDITTSTRAGEIYLHPGEEKGEEKGEENRAKTIIKIMAENPKASMSMIAKKTGLTKRQIEKTIMSLKESGKIHREGPDKGGRWVIE